VVVVLVVPDPDVEWVIDPAGKNRAWPFSLQLSAKLEKFDEVGHRLFRVLTVGGEIGEAFLYPVDG